MKKKEIATALGLSVALSMTGCASQADVDALNNQVTELTQQIESLQDEISETQNEATDATSKSAELEKQVAELQEKLETAQADLEYANTVIKSADDDTNEMSINVTKYAYDGTAVYIQTEEADEFKICEMDKNDTAYVTTIFSDAKEDGLWAGCGALKTTDENGNAIYQIIQSVEKYADGEDVPKLKHVCYFFKKIKTITVSPTEKGGEAQVINMQDLEENQEVVMIYCRSSLLSNEKVKEESKTSTQVQKEKKDTQQQQTQPSTGNSSWDDWVNSGNPCIAGGCHQASGGNWH